MERDSDSTPCSRLLAPCSIALPRSSTAPPPASRCRPGSRREASCRSCPRRTCGRSRRRRAPPPCRCGRPVAVLPAGCPNPKSKCGCRCRRWPAWWRSRNTSAYTFAGRVSSVITASPVATSNMRISGLLPAAASQRPSGEKASARMRRPSVSMSRSRDPSVTFQIANLGHCGRPRPFECRRARTRPSARRRTGNRAPGSCCPTRC